MSTLNTAALQAMDAAHYLHPFTDHKDLGERGILFSGQLERQRCKKWVNYRPIGLDGNALAPVIEEAEIVLGGG